MKKIQLIEIINFFLVVGVMISVGGIGLIATGYLDLQWLSLLLLLGYGVVVFGGVIIPLFVLLYSRILFGNQKVYGFYNPITKAIEFHIGKKVKTPIQFAKSMSIMKKHAMQMNKDIVFCTNLLSMDKVGDMEKCFGVKIEIRSVGIAEKISFYVPYIVLGIWMKKFERHTLIKGIVRFEQ